MRFSKLSCGSKPFHLKMKNGRKRCACIAKATDGKAFPRFLKSDKCREGSRAMTWQTAKAKAFEKE